MENYLAPEMALMTLHERTPVGKGVPRVEREPSRENQYPDGLIPGPKAPASMGASNPQAPRLVPTGNPRCLRCRTGQRTLGPAVSLPGKLGNGPYRERLL